MELADAWRAADITRLRSLADATWENLAPEMRVVANAEVSAIARSRLGVFAWELASEHTTGTSTAEDRTTKRPDAGTSTNEVSALCSKPEPLSLRPSSSPTRSDHDQVLATDTVGTQKMTTSTSAGPIPGQLLGVTDDASRQALDT